ncbi:MAG: hypothetical protein WBW61_10830 [Rhodanobacteraceae bacterium]
MNRSVLTTSVAVALLLAGCAAGTSTLRGGPQDQELDVSKIVAVNQWARAKGATVLWIHYPTRPKEDGKLDR